MRVIAGQWKGHRLDAPRWEGLRPTSDRLRETLFNVLAPRLEGARVLDVCAGTGAVGIEALSRGAARVTFVEADRRAVALIEANLRKCRAGEGYTIEHRDGLTPPPNAHAGPFDIVFLDPPYAHPRLDAWLHMAGSVVGPNGMVVLEHARRVSAPPAPPGLVLTRQLPQGDSSLAFYQRAREEAGGDGTA